MTQPEYDEELHQLISHTIDRITKIVQEDGQNALYTTNRCYCYSQTE